MAVALALTSVIKVALPVTLAAASKTKTGWTVGGGVEWRFAPQWSVFLEGNYYDFGNLDRTLFTHNLHLLSDVHCDFGCSFNTKATAATVLVGVNWRWGGTSSMY